MRPTLDPLRALPILLLTALAARGQDASPNERWYPEAASHLAGAHGLTGFGKMVDGRIPSPLLDEAQTRGPLGSSSTRFSLRYAYEFDHRALRGDLATYESRRHRHTLSATYGFTVQGIDVGLSVPFAQEYERLRATGGPGQVDRDYGAGDVVVALKVAFRIPKFWFGDWAVAAVGPYAVGRVPTGQPGLREPAELEAGVALAGPYGFSFRWHGNLALRQRSGGLSALVYRFGGSAVPIANDSEILRVYAHLSGVEYEGPPNSSVDLELGGQLVLGGLLTLELGVSLRLVDAGLVDGELDRRLEKRFGDRTLGSDDERALAVTFGIGVVL